MIKNTLISISLALVLIFYGFALAQTSTTARIERSQEILQKDRDLRQKIIQEDKTFVKTIIVKGALKLSEEEIKGITDVFQGSWLTKEDIQQLVDSLKLAYERKGVASSQVKISYELKKGKTLEITVE